MTNNTTDLSNLGNHFRTWRERRGLSLKQASNGIMTVQNLSQFELGKRNITFAVLNQLLLSIGVDWSSFFTYDYAGDTVDQAIYHLDGSSDVLANQQVTQLGQVLEQHYQSNPILKDMFFDYLKGVDNMKTAANTKIPANIIQHFRQLEYYNQIELLFFSAYIYQFPLDLIMKIAKINLQIMDHYLDRNQLTPLINLLACQATITNYYSFKGYHLKAQELIDQCRKIVYNYDKLAPYLGLGLLLLDMNDVYNKLRSSNPEALEEARNLIDYMDALYKHTRFDTYKTLKSAFVLGVDLLNKTGKPLYK